VGRMLTALGLVAAGLGISLVPKSVAALRPPSVRFAALVDQTAPWAPLTLAFRDGEKRPVVTDLLATTRSFAP
ncbi:MAG: LysR substrate-binding domain-containing protein, partial [Janthinobacterium lividum]